MNERVKIGDLDLEKELSPFNGHLPFENRELCEVHKAVEMKLEMPLHRYFTGFRRVFAEQSGAVYFAFRSETHGLMRYGKIPADIQKLGAEAIEKHVSQRIEAAIEPYRAWCDRCVQYMRNPNVLIEVAHQDVILRGRIIQADHQYYWLKIKEPFQGELKGGGFNRWSDMAGRHMFDNWEYVEFSLKEMKLSQVALEGAKRDLVQRYKAYCYAEKNRRSIDLVGQLNHSKNQGG